MQAYDKPYIAGMQKKQQKSRKQHKKLEKHPHRKLLCIHSAFGIKKKRKCNMKKCGKMLSNVQR